jgi:hypothetical protein
MGAKNQKNIVPRVPPVALGEETIFPECYVEALGECSGRIFLETVPSLDTVKYNFSFSCALSPECCSRGGWPSPSAGLPRVSCTFRHSGKPPFPECNSSPSATLGEDWLPRVLDFWHSGKHVTLGEFSFTRSASHYFQLTLQEPRE